MLIFGVACYTFLNIRSISRKEEPIYETYKTNYEGGNSRIYNHELPLVMFVLRDESSDVVDIDPTKINV